MLDEEVPELQKDAIIDYELHLRYFIEAQRYIHLPFAYQTVGSCMTVRSSAYQKMGGMNVRQAGEDFYFLHKYIAINRFAELNDTMVFPSARASTRVPFGTGRAVNARLQGAAQLTYHLDSFLQAGEMVNSLPDLYRQDCEIRVVKLPHVIQDFLIKSNGLYKIEEIKRETNRYETFVNRFFQWFNAFRMIKYLHFARTYYPDQPVLEQAGQFMNMIEKSSTQTQSHELLKWYRLKARTFQNDAQSIS
ncbi:MAG: hypothetical protein IPL46_18020 [Saprospiraceae bacterium]|nr:hypothetical protein [Saprospiraceae bacterium]